MLEQHTSEIQRVELTLRCPNGHVLHVTSVDDLEQRKPFLICNQCPPNEGLPQHWSTSLLRRAD